MCVTASYTALDLFYGILHCWMRALLCCSYCVVRLNKCRVASRKAGLCLRCDTPAGGACMATEHRLATALLQLLIICVDLGHAGTPLEQHFV